MITGCYQPLRQSLIWRMMDMMLKCRMLSEHPKAQAEAIARHYTACANIALDLLNIVEAKRHAPAGADTTSSDDAIRYLVDKIKQGHAHDLGIQLDWPNAPDQARLQSSPEAGCSACVVHDMTGSVPDQECKTRESAEAWVRRLTEARPNARPVIQPNVPVSGTKEYDPDQVADAILILTDISVGPIMNLKLQKLLYYSQAWYLALYGKPLFNEDFEAWVNGPIIPSQYKRFQNFKGEPIVQERSKSKTRPKLTKHLGAVLGAYGDFSSFDLAVLSHSEPPWLEARQGLSPEAQSKNIISKESMERYFRTKINR